MQVVYYRFAGIRRFQIYVYVERHVTCFLCFVFFCERARTIGSEIMLKTISVIERLYVVNR